MTKQKIIRAATNLYAQFGIKGVSMNQVASEIGISKKTIYIEFENKDELVAECLAYEIDRIHYAVEKSEHETSSSLEALLRMSFDIFGHLSTICPAFHKDLKRFTEAQEVMTKAKEEFISHYTEQLEQGVEERDFMPGLDYPLVASLFVDQISGMKFEHQSKMIFTFLRGICTEQGARKLEALLRGANPKENQIQTQITL